MLRVSRIRGAECARFNHPNATRVVGGYPCDAKSGECLEGAR